MEGIAGVVTGEQLGPQGFEYQRFREFMTNEILAAIEGARAAEVLAYLSNVERADSHTVRFRGKDILEVARFIEFVLHYEPGLAP